MGAVVLTLVLVHFAYFTYSTFDSVDSCLDNGGRWNYDQNMCQGAGTQELATSTTPIPKRELSKEEQRIFDSFCTGGDHGGPEGIYYRMTARGDSDDWLSRYWCFAKDNTKLMTLSMQQGVFSDLHVSTIPKSYLTAVYAQLKKNSVAVNSTIPELTGDKMREYGFGTCYGDHDLVVNYAKQYLRGWYVSMCGRTSDPKHPTDPKYFLTNLEGSYTKLFDYIESIVPWNEDHFPQFSDYPAVIWHGTPVSVDELTNSNEHTGYAPYTIDLKKNPNFAGHYMLITYSCGTDCQVGNIFDSKTGKDLGKIMSDGPDGFDFRLNSNLLFVSKFNKDDYGRGIKEYYLLKDGEFKLLFRGI